MSARKIQKLVKSPSDGDAAFQYWLQHRDEPGFSCRPEAARLEAFGERLKARVGRVLKEKGQI